MENKPPHIHEHLIWEILLRLPVKSLIRFKCVSKSWLALISDVNFAKLHYDLTASSRTPQLVLSVSIVDSSKAKIQFVDPEGSLESGHSVNLISPFPSSQEHSISILGVCRGFILLGHDSDFTKWEFPSSHENLIVWNPSTGIHRTLSNSEIGITLRCLPDRPVYAIYGFDYDVFTDDYFVVIAWIHIGATANCVERLELFSMRTNSWKHIDAFKDFYGTRWYGERRPIFVNGAIHWLTDMVHEPVKAIVSFDLTERNYSEIPLPDDGFVNDGILILDVIGGCLCLLGFPGKRPRSFATVWMMKEYKVKSSWTKYNYVPQHATHFPNYFFRPVYFTKAGQVVGHLFAHLARLAKFNDKGELLHKSNRFFEDYNHQKLHYIYTETLLSLPTNWATIGR